ncbi:EcsC family protein [Thiothrix winogradskyi]|uniref:EcsC family protein n=1 Tax=Thiothrix winogradskyi TaxID=96472 RepID=A0ABY3SZ43_9GAMM|nr:EcsC family protein [Thiothrix winogradskyi]UJS24767.1 EcsC family protein [Thiothrix winogradskyi]
MLTQADLADLQYAKTLLENPGLAARISNAVGTPIEKGLAMLPEGANEMIVTTTRKALETALDFALYTLDEEPQRSTNWLHKTFAGLSGAAGGAFGLPALAIELPVSTAIILRSIADIARSEGESIKSPEARLACLEVFALGGSAANDDAVESGYFTVRAVLAKSLAEATQYLAVHGVAQKTAPPLVRLLTQIAARFGIPVTQKAVAQSLPVVGAAGGALINTLFVDHFQNMSRGHFIVRRLERVYGTETVKLAYLKL